MPDGMYKQRGVTLLIFAIVIALSAIAYFLKSIKPEKLIIDRQEHTRSVLKNAKQTLIAHAITHSDQPGDEGEFGNLPCPDYVIAGFGEGVPDSPCGNAKAVTLGYYPWRAIGMGVNAFKDYSGNCLYYVTSPAYKITTTKVMLNEDSNGTIQIVDTTGAVIAGVNAESRPVAVVLSAGQALSAQNRSPDDTSVCGNDYNNLAAYLDNDGITDNANPNLADDVIVQFVNASAGSIDTANPVNDQLIAISREEIWGPIVRRSDFITKMDNLTQALAMCLVEYSKNNSVRRLPWPAPLDFAGADYRVDANYNDTGGSSLYAGRFPYLINDSNTVIGVAGDILLDRAECQSLTLDNGTVVTFAANDEYRKLWENWKDHFYYALSKVYEPVPAPAPNSECNTVVNDCITVDPYPYIPAEVARAGVVFYSGSRRPGQIRNAPPPVGDNDDKAIISNYLENGNDVVFAGAVGTEADYYQSTDPNNSNDVMWCIKNEVIANDLQVVKCY